MTDARRALAHFLELADKGPALRAALAEELARLLADWPDDYPPEMHKACEALRRKALLEIARQENGETREDDADVDRAGGLVAAAREGTGFHRIFASRLGISRERAEGILADRSGHELAIACKGAHLGRPAFSALAILAGGPAAEHAARLAAYETVTARHAARTLDAWRAMERFSRAAA